MGESPTSLLQRFHIGLIPNLRAPLPELARHSAGTFAFRGLEVSTEVHRVWWSLPIESR